MTSNVDPNITVKAAFERASAMLHAGDMQMAEAICRDGLRRFPDDGNLLCLLGGVLIRQHRPVEAENPLRNVIERFPDFAKAHEELGNAMLAQQRLDEAAASLQRTLELEPGNDLAKLKLEKVQAALRRPDTAANGQGFLQEVLARDPDNPDAYRLMGVEALQQGHPGDAVVLLKKAISIDPDFVVGWIDLGRAHAAQGDFAQAVDATRHAVDLEPRALLPHVLSAGYLSRMGRYNEAIAKYNDGLATAPGNRDCLLGLGHALRTIGRHAGSVAAYREVMRTQPAAAEAYWSLANLKNARFEPDEIDMMRQQVANDDLSDDERAQFMFALGKAYEDEADYERSFGYYETGNAVQRKLESYDPVDTQTTNDHIIEFFDQTLFADKADSGDPDPAPIFIVGLPRSGSTLVEQILASHSMVEGTRELPDLERLSTGLKPNDPSGEGYPEAISSMDAAGLAALGRRYLEATQRYRSGSPHFTDKMPTNFRHIGFIHLILPSAKIVNVQRHPLDSCLGSFKQLFAQGQPYSYDLFELGEYYLEYRRLMAHWHKVLPGRVLDVQYEELVAEPEMQIRRLIEYCGLEWEAACLNFHETERPIESASSEQVRQPLYTTSVNNWRHYENQLTELIETLRPLLLRLPEDQRPESLR